MKKHSVNIHAERRLRMKSRLSTYLTRTLLALGVSVVTLPPTFAGVALNTIDLVAHLTEGGRELTVTGPIACTAGERLTLRVTVTQRSTGAVAEGHTRFMCTGALQQWEVRIVRHKKAAFAAGTATAVARANSTAQGEPTDAHQWLVECTLVDEASVHH
jgi:hypothetical protein